MRLKDQLRSQVVDAGLGARLANAIRSKRYPETEPSLNASALVWAKSPKIFAAFEEGTVVRSPKGIALAIPTEHAPKRGPNGRKISPSNFPESAYGKLKFVPTEEGIGLLVVENLRARTGKRKGGFTKGSATAIKRKQVQTVPMFVLIPQARLKKRLDFEGPANTIADRIPGLIVNKWEQLSKGKP